MVVIRALTVCVQCDDRLRVTLARNAQHFESVCVVTTPDDEATQAIVESVPNAVLHETEVFWKDGALFNKGAAIEEGLDAMGRRGWIAILDADILLPEFADLSKIEPGNLYTAQRRICPYPKRWQEPWEQWRALNEAEWAGYCQVFHADDPVLAEKPWYPTDCPSRGSDSPFQAKWPRQNKRRLPFCVLHLGLPRQNWFGRKNKSPAHT